MDKIWDLFCISPEKGAENSIYLATSPEVEGKTGLYFERMKLKRSSKRSYDPELGARLWNACSRLTGVA